MSETDCRHLADLFLTFTEIETVEVREVAPNHFVVDTDQALTPAEQHALEDAIPDPVRIALNTPRFPATRGNEDKPIVRLPTRRGCRS